MTGYCENLQSVLCARRDRGRGLVPTRQRPACASGASDTAWTAPGPMDLRACTASSSGRSGRAAPGWPAVSHSLWHRILQPEDEPGRVSCRPADSVVSRVRVECRDRSWNPLNPSEPVKRHAVFTLDQGRTRAGRPHLPWGRQLWIWVQVTDPLPTRQWILADGPGWLRAGFPRPAGFCDSPSKWAACGREGSPDTTERKHSPAYEVGSHWARPPWGCSQKGKACGRRTAPRHGAGPGQGDASFQPVHRPRALASTPRSPSPRGPLLLSDE